MTHSEMLFLVEEATEGGFIAKAAGASIFTEADTLEELKAAILDALRCHFDRVEDIPVLIRLHIVKEETLIYA